MTGKNLATPSILCLVCLLCAPAVSPAAIQEDPSSSEPAVELVDPAATDQDPAAAPGRGGCRDRSGTTKKGKGMGCCGGQNATAEGGPGCCGGNKAPAGKGKGCCAGRGAAAGDTGGPGCRGRGGQGRHQAYMPDIHGLVDAHSAIQRTVEEIDGGVRTRTVSDDAELVPMIRRHAAEMAALLESGGGLRHWDPLFREITAHTDAIVMSVEEIDGGVLVTETSSDPEVTKLIQAHAAKVNQFVERGWEAYREETPLPEDYAP